jgi:hypothetical protein
MTAAATTGELDVEEITAGHDPGPSGGALRRLISAINTEAALTPAGLRSAAASFVRSIAVQRQVAARLAGAAPGPPPPVLVITGLHRTGTTLLQGLLAAHPDLHAPRLWELLDPASDESRDDLVASASRYVAEYYAAAPGFAAIHPLHAGKPEECHRLIANSFRSEIFAMRYRIPGYADWLDGQDQAAGYQLHRDQLSLILARRPGRHVVLKCPFHLWHPEHLAATYPQARVVRLHRDPAATVASVCSLTATIRRARSDRVDTGEIGDFWHRRTVAALPRLLAPGPDAFGGLPVLDVRYPDLARDPVGVVRRVCEFAGAGFGPDAERRVRRAATTAGRDTGGHHYRAADFGIDPARATRVFAAYRAAYQL